MFRTQQTAGKRILTDFWDLQGPVLWRGFSSKQCSSVWHVVGEAEASSWQQIPDYCWWV